MYTHTRSSFFFFFFSSVLQFIPRALAHSRFFLVCARFPFFPFSFEFKYRKRGKAGGAGERMKEKIKNIFFPIFFSSSSSKCYIHIPGVRIYIILEYNIFLNWEGNRKEKRHRRRRPGHHVDKIWLWLDIYIYFFPFFSLDFSHIIFLFYLSRKKKKKKKKIKTKKELDQIWIHLGLGISA